MKYSFFSSELFCPPSALIIAVSASAASSAPLASWVKYVPRNRAGEGCCNSSAGHPKAVSVMKNTRGSQGLEKASPCYQQLCMARKREGNREN